MNETTGNVDLLAYCGLYCGQCRAKLKGRCPGCHENARATWCKVRSCCMERHYASCADCTEASDPAACRKYNTLISKLFGLIFRSDRRACILRIRQAGPQAFCDEMAASHRQTIHK